MSWERRLIPGLDLDTVLCQRAGSFWSSGDRPGARAACRASLAEQGTHTSKEVMVETELMFSR